MKNNSDSNSRAAATFLMDTVASHCYYHNGITVDDVYHGRLL